MNDSRFLELARLIESWPGLVAGPPGPLIEDCLVLVPYLEDVTNLVDVGSGGGLPGLPLKISRPSLAVTLVESDQAKAAFLLHTLTEMNLSGVEVVSRPAEAAGRDPLYRERFDVAVARALAPMPVLAELCLPLVKVGGRLLAQKTAAEDVAGARHAIESLGGSLEGVVPAASHARASGTIVVVRKVSPTPPEYPRRPGVPRRRPLG